MPLSPTPVDAETGAPTPAVDPTVVHFPVHNATVEFPASMSLDEVQQAASKIHEQFNQGAGALSQGLGGPATADEAEQMVSNTPAGFIHPFDSLKTAVSGIVGSANNADLLDKAKSAWNSGDKITAARHFTNALIPFVGQNSDKAGDELVNGSFGKAVGHTLAAIAPFFLGRESSPAETGATETEAAASAAKRPTNDIPNRSSESNPNASLGDARNIVQRRIAQADAVPAATDFVPSRISTAEEIGAQDALLRRYEQRAAERPGELGDADRAAAAYIRRNRATLPEHSAVEVVHGAVDDSAINLGGKTVGKAGADTVPTETEVNDFIRKQYGDNAPTVKIVQDAPAKTSRAEVNAAADKASNRFTHDYKYSKSDSTHRVDITDSEGKPVGYVTGVEVDPRTIKIDKAQITKPGQVMKGHGTTAYKELIDNAQKQGKDVVSGAVRSDAAEGVWKNLREEGYNVRTLPDDSYIIRAPKTPALKPAARPTLDLTNDMNKALNGQ